MDKTTYDRGLQIRKNVLGSEFVEKAIATAAPAVDQLRLIPRLLRLMRETRPDVVHLVALKPAVLGGLAAAFVPGPRVVHAIAGLGYAFSGDDWRRRSLRAGLEVMTWQANTFSPFAGVALFYLLLTLPLVWLNTRLEQRYRIH